MKTLLIRLQILLIILVVFSPLIYLGYKKLSPQINLFKYDLAQKNISYPAVSLLHTLGTKLVNAKNEPVLLRGVNLISTNWGESYETWNPSAIDRAARDWHVNILRTRIYQHEYESNPAQFFLSLEQQILTPARKNGLYVILHPWLGENESLPDNGAIKMWLAVASRYSKDPHIIFDPLAEPRDISFEELQSTYLSLIPKIRSIAPDSLIFVTGLDWGRDINAWLDSPLPYNNIVYRSNPYNRTAEFPGYFDKIALKYPVFLGEFGTEDKLSMTTVDVANLLAYADSLGIGWTAWHFTSNGCPCLLSDESNFTPSIYGQIVKDNLSGKRLPFTLPIYDTDPSKLYVYSDFLESGFADYSWGITNILGPNISTNFHNYAGLFLSSSRRINPKDYQTFNLNFETKIPGSFGVRFKSWDNKLSNSFQLVNGTNTISTSQIDLSTISGILIETIGTIPDPTPVTLDQIYFKK